MISILALAFGRGKQGLRPHKPRSTISNLVCFCIECNCYEGADNGLSGQMSVAGAPAQENCHPCLNPTHGFVLCIHRRDRQKVFSTKLAMTATGAIALSHSGCQGQNCLKPLLMAAHEIPYLVIC